MEGTSNITDKSTESSQRPKHIRPELWEKFLSLKKRTNDATKHSTERRINELKKTVMKTVTEELTHPDDMDIMREHDVKFGPPIDPQPIRKRKRGRADTPKEPVPDKDWLEVRSYMGVNDHLKGLDQGRDAPKTRLEDGIDQAVGIGDFDLAESLSNDLAKRDFGTKIAKAFDARDYVKKIENDKQSSKAKKKQKPYWGFNQKQNWEMKCNM